MTFRLTPALCLFLLAGCQSSEPQNASYAPVAATPSMQAAPLPAPALPASDARLARVPLPAAPATTSMSANPAEPSAPSAYEPSIPGAAATEPPAALPPGAANCSTVDGVTLCDAPADVGTNNAGADAYSTDEKLYTN
jgi:hypothetical protein